MKFSEKNNLCSKRRTLAIQEEGRKELTGPVDLVIFDMDGTIFDTEWLGVRSWIQAFEEMNLPVPLMALIGKLGLNSEDAKKLITESVPVEFDYEYVKSRKRAIMKERIDRDGVVIKPGFQELMTFLKKHQIKTALATSRVKDMTYYYLERAGKHFPNFFDLIVTGDMVARGKPAPDIFLYVTDHLGVNPQNALVIEDSLNGVKGAVAAHIPVIMIPDLSPPSPIAREKASIKKDLGEVIGVIQRANSDLIRKRIKGQISLPQNMFQK